MVDRDKLLEIIAKAICPYGWNDTYWQTPVRIGQFDRNQKHVQRNALTQASCVLSRLKGLGYLEDVKDQT